VRPDLLAAPAPPSALTEGNGLDGQYVTSAAGDLWPAPMPGLPPAAGAMLIAWRGSAAHPGLGFGQSGLEFFRTGTVDLRHRFLDRVRESLVDRAGAAGVVDDDDASRARR